MTLAASNSTLVSVNGLGKKYGSFVALRDCCLQVQSSEVFGLLGPNGAGKTTLLRLLLGLLRPSSGSASIAGLDCYRQSLEVHRRLAYLPGDARLFRTMRASSVLRFFSQIRHEASYPRACQLAERLELDLSRWVAFMSTGTRQKLALCACLSVDVPLLILDEPTSNLDPTVRGEVLKLVLEARQSGRTVIFSSHVLSEIEEICDRVGILRAGQLVHLQSLHQLKRQHRIVAAVTGELPPPPPSLQDQLKITRHDQQVQIDTPGDLSPVLGWLATLPLTDVYVTPAGLRAVYDRFHHPSLDDV